MTVARTVKDSSGRRTLFYKRPNQRSLVNQNNGIVFINQNYFMPHKGVGELYSFLFSSKVLSFLTVLTLLSIIYQFYLLLNCISAYMITKRFRGGETKKIIPQNIPFESRILHNSA